jgi:hypothetical protein
VGPYRYHLSARGIDPLLRKKDDLKGERKMKKIKLGMIFLVAVAFFAVLVLQAQSKKDGQPREAKEKAVPVQPKDKAEPKQAVPTVSEMQFRQPSFPQRAPFTGSRQGYQLVTDVLGGFGGESESDNYRIPVNSGGQPAAIGISDSDTLGIEAGFVYASSVRRGDANADRVVNVGDVVYLVNYLYKGGPEPCPIEAGDVNCDGIVNVGDVVFLVNYLYKGGPPPAC